MTSGLEVNMLRVPRSNKVFFFSLLKLTKFPTKSILWSLYVSSIVSDKWAKENRKLMKNEFCPTLFYKVNKNLIKLFLFWTPWSRALLRWVVSYWELLLRIFSHFGSEGRGFQFLSRPYLLRELGRDDPMEKVLFITTVGAIT